LRQVVRDLKVHLALFLPMGYTSHPMEPLSLRRIGRNLSMHGRTLARIVLLLGAGIIGCDDATPVVSPPAPLPDAASDFNPATAGTIAGQVTWEGDVPVVAPFSSPVNTISEPIGNKLFWANPNAPVVEAQSRGVVGAILFLRGLDPRRSRPWDHPPVHVRMRDYQLVLEQGASAAPTAFVRRGDAVEMVSEQAAFHSLQARGAAFFSLAFPDAGRPRRRVLSQAGLVELSSGAGYFWMRGYLFVDDHPYYTRTDGTGHFRLEQVPPGVYELVCWLPSWHEADHERDGDTCLICRFLFRPPVEVVQRLVLDRAEAKTVAVKVTADLFGSQGSGE
jgi:hypothetical protein